MVTLASGGNLQKDPKIKLWQVRIRRERDTGECGQVGLATKVCQMLGGLLKPFAVRIIHIQLENNDRSFGLLELHSIT